MRCIDVRVLRQLSVDDRPTLTANASSRSVEMLLGHHIEPFERRQGYVFSIVSTLLPLHFLRPTATQMTSKNSSMNSKKAMTDTPSHSPACPPRSDSKSETCEQNRSVDNVTHFNTTPRYSFKRSPIISLKP